MTVRDLTGSTEALRFRRTQAGEREREDTEVVVESVLAHGATGDGTIDDTAAIQAAVDAANLSALAGRSTVVYFPPGVYSVTAQITLRYPSLIGDEQQSVIEWNGAAGGTAFVQGTSNHSAIRGLMFRDGANRPATWIDFQIAPDSKAMIESCQFQGPSSHAILLSSGLINCFMRSVTFYDCGSYAMRVVYPVGSNKSVFVLDGFTYDHAQAGDSAPGFVQFDNTAGVSDVGVAQITNGRIEVGVAWGSFKSAFVVTSATGGSPTRWLGLRLDNVTLQDVVGMTGDSLIYSDCDVNQILGFTLTGVRSDTDSLLAGATAQTIIKDRSGAAFATSQGTATMHDPLVLQASTTGDKALRVFEKGSASDRFHIDGAGTLWLKGDVKVYRSSADVLKTDDSFKTGQSTTAGRPAAGTVGVGAQWYDTDLSKPIWSDGTDWRDAAGTVV